MIDSVVFIGAMIAALTQVVKIMVPQVSGVLTVLVAVLVGVLVALVGPSIGVAHLSVAQGILTGLATAGVHTVVSAGKPSA